MNSLSITALSCAIVLFGQSLCGISAEDEAYFPDLVFEKEKDDNDFSVEWYSQHLKAMKEPSLWRLSQKDRSATVYRFLWLPTFDHPVSVRIIKSTDSIEARVVKLGGMGGYQPGKIAVRKRTKLSKEQWEEFKRRLDKSKFWTLPTKDQEEFGNDGDQLIVEGVKGGKYHIVDRWSPDSGAYFELCQSMLLDLSGIDVRKVWKEYHE